ncbi:MAG: ATP-binding cassette domain-containing protein, partial [Pseudomonadota bacterium]|nr:ATP-binding cassette domain-containing protein [Pseudomonadota bacterium]
MQLNALKTPQLDIPHWQVQPGECWAVLGRNGSGKRHLADLLTGKSIASHGTVHVEYRDVALLSFEQQQAFYEKELHDDDTDFMDSLDPGTTVRELLGIGADIPDDLKFLKLDHVLDRGYRLLSSGESRKALLAQALLQKPELLILDEPFDSLDIASKAALSDYFQAVLRKGETALLFLLNTVEDIHPWHTHIAFMEVAHDRKGTLLAQGTRDDILGNPDLLALLSFDAAKLPPWPETLPQDVAPEPLVRLRNGHVEYGDTVIFRGLDLELNHGDHTLITGANGSGKSTLLSLIVGDHPQCYGNDLTLFGRRRGSGETIWDIKRRLGLVSPALHRDHRVPGSALEIVASGFFDSIGLYQTPNEQQVRHAKCWLALVGLADNANVPFKLLSYGEQRLVLIARALVKQPALLILDEPTQGLDDINRHRVLYFLDHLSSQ